MKLVLLLFAIFLYAEDFITNAEYGKMLYENPRGIGCIKCHGVKGKGRVIATYVEDDTGKKRRVVAPNISKVSWAVFYNRLKVSKILKNGYFRTLNYSFMPKYNYLMDDEIQSIYNYIKVKNEKLYYGFRGQ